MANMIAAAIERLRGPLNRPTHGRIVSTAIFPDIDLEKTKDDLRPEERGRSRGELDQPTTLPDQPDEVEREILSFVEGARKQALDMFHDHLRSYEDRLRHLDIAGRAQEIELAARDALSDFRSATHGGVDELHGPWERLATVSQEYAIFRSRNGITHAAYVPASLILHSGLIAFLLLAETVLNGVFFARGNELGLIGGFADALVISMLNVAISCIFGRLLLPQAWHRYVWRRIVGVSSMVFWAIGIFIFNLFVGHYRDALGAADPTTAISTGLAAFREDPLALADFKSWALVGLGCLAAFVALIDGFRMVDPYPGYTTVARKLAEAEDDYTNLKAELKGKLEDRKAQVVDALRAAQEDIGKRRAEHLEIRNARTRLVEGLSAHLRHLHHIGGALLAAYREANLQTRRSAAPARFAQPVRFPEAPLVAVDAGPDPAEMEAQVQRVFVSAGNAMHEIFSEYDAAWSRYPEIDELKPRGGQGGRISQAA